MSLDAKTGLDMFFTMLRIRRVQEAIEAKYLEDRMKTPVHLYIGQEAIAAGVCAALRRDDSIQSNHRSHGHYLAKGGDLKALMAELHCKKDGCSGGFGGSMHVIDTSVGHLGSSSIVGGGIPIGTGMAMSMAMKGDDRVSVVFFGDGAADEGVLYESVNFAMLRKLPVIYVMENNKWSVCSPVAARHPQDNVFHRGATPDNLFTAKIDGNDAHEVHATALAAVRRAREGRGPSFIECDTYRILGHAGCKAQDAPGYRDACEIDDWGEKCPVKRLKDKLMADGVLAEPELGAMEEGIAAEIKEAFDFAEASPLPGGGDLHQNLFSE